MAANNEDNVPSAITTETPPIIDADISMTANNNDPPSPAINSVNKDDTGIEANKKDSFSSVIKTEESDIVIAANNEGPALPAINGVSRDTGTKANSQGSGSLTVDKDDDKSANNKDMASAVINRDAALSVDKDTGKTYAPQATDSDAEEEMLTPYKIVEGEALTSYEIVQGEVVTPDKIAEEEMLTLDKIATNLTKLAQEGKLNPLDGREEVVDRVIQILCKRSKCNPCLIGSPGVGKTAIIEVLAQRIQSGNVPKKLKEKKVISIASHHPESRLYNYPARRWTKLLRGKIIKENEQSPDMIIFLDEDHTTFSVYSLKSDLEKGDVQYIAAVRTLDEYTRNSELENLFQPVQVPETSIDDTIKILKRFRGLYETHHEVQYTDEALAAAVKLSSRYFSGGILLDKAIDVIDEAGSRVQLLQAKEPDSLLHSNKRIKTTETDTDETSIMVSREDIQHIVSSQIGIPVHEVSKEESERLLKLEETLHESIIGQHDALEAIANAIRRSRVGLKSTKRPIASFIFTGPTGVGKTEVAKALARQYFGSEDFMVRFDMSEYMERHEVSKLIGSPNGYWRCDEGGQLTEAVKCKPHTVVLFDEIEKAHPDVMHIMLQILEDGRLTDNKGETVNFSNTIIIMTSNVGGDVINRKSSSCVSDGKINNLVMKEIKKNFRPEFLNRFDEIIIFKQLTKGEVNQIAELMFKEVGHRLKAKDIKLGVSDKFRERVVNEGCSPCHGARQLRRVITKLLENILANKLLSKEIKEGDSVLVDVDSEGTIKVLLEPKLCGKLEGISVAC